MGTVSIWDDEQVLAVDGVPAAQQCERPDAPSCALTRGQRGQLDVVQT